MKGERRDEGRKRNEIRRVESGGEYVVIIFWWGEIKGQKINYIVFIVEAVRSGGIATAIKIQKSEIALLSSNFWTLTMKTDLGRRQHR